MTWTLHDPVTAETYPMPIGPTKLGTLDRQRSPVYADIPSTAIFLNQLTPPMLDYTGTLLVEGEYVTLTRWAAKGHPVQIIDDRGVTINVLITEWTPVRVRKANNPWYHTWTLKVLVLDATA